MKETTMQTTIIDGLEVPVVPMLNTRILEALEQGGELDMSLFHHHYDDSGAPCGTTHCIAGWAVMVSGGKGINLNAGRSTDRIARLIFEASCPTEPFPNFYETEGLALLHLRERAAREQSAALDVDRLREDAREGKAL